jgi:hypothetical protein
MKCPIVRRRALFRAPALCFVAVACAAIPQTFAQEATNAPVAPADDTIVQLDPFVVSTSNDADGYAVKDTLAGTRVRTDLRDVASSLVVVNKKFMQDIGATNNETLLQYTGSTEVGGVGGNFLGGNYPASADSYGQNASLLRPNSNTRVRGLDAADNTRDFFLTEIPWDNYIVDRVDIQRGPNSILFGVGSPAGIINSSINTAGFKTAYKFENRIDKWGSLRNSIDVNQVLISDTLAIRVAGLDDRKKFEQKPAFEDVSRIYGALRYAPKLIANGNTSIRANFEHGKITANRPRTLTPLDQITPWFGEMNKQSFDPSVESPTSTVNAANTWVNNIAVGRQYWPGTVAYYGDPSGNATPSYYTPLISTKNGINATGAIDQTIGGQIFARMFAIADYKTHATNAGFDGAGYFSTKSLTDSTIFNFYENLIDGDNKREWQNWNAANLAISQTFFDNRLGFEVVYDGQRYKEGQESIFNGGSAYGLGVDINTNLLDGSPNPNFGRPYVSGSTESGGNDAAIDRDAVRLTAFGELRAEDFMKKSWLTDLIGRHSFTGLLSNDSRTERDRNYALALADTSYPVYLGEDPALGGHIRAYNWQAYLGDSLANSSSASGAYISRINMRIDAPATAPVRFFDDNWAPAVGVNPGDPYTYVDANGLSVDSTQSENPANYIGWSTRNVNFAAASRGDKEALITDDSRKRNEVKSQGIIWQGHMFNDSFVPVFGWRRDTVNAKKGADAPDSLGMVDGSYSYDPSRNSRQVGESKSWGAVLHLPKSLAAKLPGNSSISVFYNRSSNFKADEPRQDVFGTILDNPRGNTKEYGFAVSTLDDKIGVKVNWFETKVANATLPYGTGFSYQQWAYPAWFVAHVARYQAVRDGLQGDTNWDYDGATGVTPDTLTAALADAKNIPVDQAFFTSYGREVAQIDLNAFKSGDYYTAWPLWSNGRVDPQPGSDAVQRVGTGDTTSKGIEFELTAQPVPNWNLTANVTKVKAQYSSISPTIAKYMDAMTAFFDGPAGDIRMWGEGGTSFRTAWANDVVSSYNTLLAYVGNSAPEIAPWRANLVTGYSFNSGALKGAFVGGGYRWEDKKILGYGLMDDAALGKKVVDSNHPLYGPSDDHFDLWVGYSRRFSHNINWRIQLNVRNVGENHHLVPASLEPDGTWALARIAEGMTWQLTNTFEF